MVLASAAKVVADNLAVIHPCSHVEKRISAVRISRYAAAECGLHVHEIAVNVGDEI